MNHLTKAKPLESCTSLRGRMLTVSGLMLLTVLITLLSLLPASASAQVLLQGSVAGQLAPGVYGRVDFGSGPPPAVIYQQPIIVRTQPVFLSEPYEQVPIYLVVPPGHSRNRNQWHRYCARYDACGQPVYFVRPARYYRQAYAPAFRPVFRPAFQPVYPYRTTYRQVYAQPPHNVYALKTHHGRGHGKGHGKGHNRHN